MYQFTSDGQAVILGRDDVATFEPSDVKFAALWVQAAVTADEEDFCPQYDRIARAIGGPDRDALRELGLLPTRDYDVRVSRTVRVYQDVTQYGTVTVTANNADDARDEASISGDIDWDDDLNVDRWSYEIDEDSIDSNDNFDIEDVTQA